LQVEPRLPHKAVQVALCDRLYVVIEHREDRLLRPGPEARAEEERPPEVGAHEVCVEDVAPDVPLEGEVDHLMHCAYLEPQLIVVLAVVSATEDLAEVLCLHPLQSLP
jgi:hypothetical protein